MIKGDYMIYNSAIILLPTFWDTGMFKWEEAKTGVNFGSQDIISDIPHFSLKLDKYFFQGYSDIPIKIMTDLTYYDQWKEFLENKILSEVRSDVEPIISILEKFIYLNKNKIIQENIQYDKFSDDNFRLYDYSYKNHSFDYFGNLNKNIGHISKKYLAKDIKYLLDISENVHSSNNQKSGYVDGKSLEEVFTKAHKIYTTGKKDYDRIFG
jgi:hypothetical protein